MCARMLVDGADSRSLLQGLGDGSDNGGVAECRKDITAACPRWRRVHSRLDPNCWLQHEARATRACYTEMLGHWWPAALQEHVGAVLSRGERHRLYRRHCGARTD